ncbi:MAG: hypothetical protein WCK98_01865 [bacterium]
MTNPFAIPLIFQYLALFLAFSFGNLQYMFLVFKKKAIPNITTWVAWSLAPIISFIVSLLAGANWTNLIVLFVAGFGPLLVVITALICKQYYLKSKLLDLVCFVLAVIGLIFYFLTKDVLVAQLILVIVDFTATFPMLYKIWFSKSDNEPLIPFAIYFATYTISLLTQPIFTISSTLFLGYLVLLTILIISSISIKNLRLKKLNQ